MANVHATRFAAIRGCRVVAVCDVDAGRAREFAAKHAIPTVHTDLGKLLATPGIDAVSIVTPDPFHAPIALECIAAGKHVLCEKPLALNHGDARKMTLAAEKSGVINMVNLSYRDWPSIQAVAALVADGGIGAPLHIEASYLQGWLVSRRWGDWRTSPHLLWRLSTRHGSNGVLGDIGIHIVDFAMFPAGPIANVYCRLKTFPKAPRNRVGKYRLDANDSAAISAVFRNGALGCIQTTRWCGGHANRLFLRIAGTEGTVEVGGDLSENRYRICAGRNLDANTWQEVAAKPTPTNYERFIRSIRTGKTDEPVFRRGMEAQKVLDACFESARRDAPVKV